MVFDKSYLELSLILFLLILAGIADAICDAWRDGKAPLRSWFSNDFYRGGSTYANDGWPWRSDFWHNAKLIREFSFCAAIGVALGGWFLLLIPVFAFVKGKTFYVFYHYIFRSQS